MKRPSKEGSYTTWLVYALLVVLSWGIVPLFAQKIGLPGGITTAVVNWSAVVALVAIMTYKKRLSDMLQWHLYPRGLALGILWPLAYSLLYFNVIDNAGGTIATITNYTWPLWSVTILFLFAGRKVNIVGLVTLIVELMALIIFVANKSNASGSLLSGWVIAGLGAGFLQAAFNVINAHKNRAGQNDWFSSEYVWLWTFLGALVTAIGSTVYTVLFEQNTYTVTNLIDWWPLVVIGVLGNALGFAWFLLSNQKADHAGQSNGFALVMMWVPVVQVGFLMLFGYEQLTLIQVGCVVVLALCLAFYNILGKSSSSGDIVPISE